MKGLQFQTQKPIVASAPNRMDIACFVGLAPYRGGVSREVRHWLYRRGWLNSEDGFSATYHRDGAERLLDVPVPLESFESFENLFIRDESGRDTQGGTSYLGAAVRSFFAQGGRKCYVVRVGEPLQLNANEAERESQIIKVLPGYPAALSANKSDRRTWRGVGHLFGLPDVSFLCLPDLADLVHSSYPRIPTDKPDSPQVPEQFVVCSDPSPAPAQDHDATDILPPGTDAGGYERWGRAMDSVANFVSEHHRVVQVVAGIPLPHASAQKNILSTSISSIASAFVQLCYPWLKTPGSQLLPGQVEPPEGAFAGMLARNALTKGTFRNASRLTQSDITDLYPKLRREQVYALHPEPLELALIDRVSLFSPTPEGIKIISDVTTSSAAAFRPANVNRILAMVLRAARTAGEEYVFESNGEALWTDIKAQFNGLLLSLYHLGALRGREPEEAFSVRCDRSTMTQQDIDSGRVVAEIHIEPVASIESIEVLLSMAQGGQVSLRSLGIEEAVA